MARELYGSLRVTYGWHGWNYSFMFDPGEHEFRQERGDRVYDYEFAVIHEETLPARSSHGFINYIQAELYESGLMVLGDGLFAEDIWGDYSLKLGLRRYMKRKTLPK